MRKLVLAVVAGAAMTLPLVGSAAAAPPNGDTTPVPPFASNMGYCSSYLAADLKVRDDINHVIKEYGSFLGLSSPGDLYSVRAQQHVQAGTPAQECLPRNLPGGGQG